MTIIVQELNRIIISNTRERSFDILQLGDIAAYRFQLSTTVGQYRLYDKADEFFLNFQTFFVIRESHLRLDHPGLDQVAAGL
ncbi:hypothetical protein D3C75_1279450 [compost metagenome]